MPLSITEGKRWACKRIEEIAPRSVVDVGAGQGTYAIMGRHLCPKGSRWTAVEIFEPYVDRFLLNHRYDDVQVADVRDWDMPPADLYIFGDVLEHMHAHEARTVIAQAKQRARHILVSLPIVDAPQGECFGNASEEHLHQWKHLDMWAALDYTPHVFVGHTIGAYLWSRPKPGTIG